MSIAEGQGRWVPVHTGFKQFLPKDRKYTELEAAFCVQIDYDRGNTVTVLGYSTLWKWSRETVDKFLTKYGASIEYPEPTQKKQNQRGQITLHNTSRNPTHHRQIRFIDNRSLQGVTQKLSADSRQIPGSSPHTTVKTEEVRKEKEKKEKHPPSPDALRLSGRLANLILKNTPGNSELIDSKRDVTVQRWAADIDKLHRIDGQDWKVIELVIEWCQDNDFWKTTILSGNAVRRHYNKLVAKMEAEPKVMSSYMTGVR